MLLKAAQVAGVEPGDCLMIDDNTSGIRAAQAAGMLAIELAADGDTARLASTGAHIVTTLAQVVPLLDQ